MLIKIQKWGNSLALRIPKAFASESNIQEDEFVNLRLDENRIVIEPVEEDKFLLEELVLRINKTNLHSEVDFGRNQGNESW